MVAVEHTLDASFCARAVQRAIDAHGAQEIFDSDQGCQFTSAKFTEPLLALGIKLSMDGKGRCLDNVFVERLWRTVKYEEVYLKSYVSLVDAHGVSTTSGRPHSSLGDATPAEVYHATTSVAVNQ